MLNSPSRHQRQRGTHILRPPAPAVPDESEKWVFPSTAPQGQVPLRPCTGGPLQRWGLRACEGQEGGAQGGPACRPTAPPTTHAPATGGPPPDLPFQPNLNNLPLHLFWFQACTFLLWQPSINCTCQSHRFKCKSILLIKTLLDEAFYYSCVGYNLSLLSPPTQPS